MNAIVDLKGTPHRLARLDRRAVLALMEDGTLPRDRKIEMLDGILIESGERIDHPYFKREPLEVSIHGFPHQLARLDGAAIDTLIKVDALPELGKIELIDGVLIEMSPASNAHGRALSYVLTALVTHLPRHLACASDVAIHLSDKVVLGPDIVLLPDEIDTRHARGPDLALVVEISDTTLARDLGEKSRLYGTHGVPEYWVVDLPGRKLHRHLQPSVDGFAEIQVFDWTDPVTPLCLPDATLNLSEVIDR